MVATRAEETLNRANIDRLNLLEIDTTDKVRDDLVNDITAFINSVGDRPCRSDRREIRCVSILLVFEGGDLGMPAHGKSYVLRWPLGAPPNKT